MRQRVMIAMALSCQPRVLIADEPTTALDVTIQAEILDLLESLQERFHTALLLITHDLGIVAQRVSEVVIMYAGRVVERGATESLFRAPLHPYTRGLLDSIPRMGGRAARLAAIPGAVPDPARRPSGCRFRDRCGLAIAACGEADPPLVEHRPDHWAACLRAGEV
jgi:oligopeptide/dipeptide ABC transporter ATP-binding protein